MQGSEIYPHRFKVDHSMRSQIKDHLPMVLWLTGLSGSGKSTIANQLDYELVTKHKAHTYLLDGDNIRTGLNSDLGFSDKDRKENIRRIGEVSKLMYDAGLIVITAFISPFSSDRLYVRNLLPADGFLEIFVSCPISVCQQRDPKGLYQKALNGDLQQFTGISSTYEEPESPELVIQSDQLPLDKCVSTIIDRLKSKNIIH